MSKANLRDYFTKVLKEMDEKDKVKIETAIQKNLIQSPHWKNAYVIGITVSGILEWETRRLIDVAWSEGKVVCVPKCFPDDKKLVFYKLSSYDQLENVYHHLLEPKPINEFLIKKENIDLVIVPGIGFDFNGYRIGFGGGYYDRFLADYKGNTISLAMNKQIVESINKEKHDIPVKHLISETGMIF